MSSSLNLINSKINNFNINLNNSNLISFSNIILSNINFTGNGNTLNTISDNYNYISFINSGKLIITGSSIICDILIVGGGGGGGADGGGGGGGGGVVYLSSYTLYPDIYDITIGTGGNGGLYSANPKNGTNGNNSYITSSILNIGAAGGGGGGSAFGAISGLPGNNIYNSSGGGGGAGAYQGITGGSGGSYSGSGGNSIYGGSGGGGGAGTNNNGNNDYTQLEYVIGEGMVENVYSGNGANGFQSSITSINKYYGGGGGGASVNISANGLSDYGTGGMGGNYNTSGNSGSSGIVIIRFSINDNNIINLPITSINYNLGIGNSIPYAPLWIGNPNINNSSGYLVISNNSNNINKSNYKIGYDNNNNFSISYYGSNNYFYNDFFNNKFLINYNGNVAIGNTIPTINNLLTIKSSLSTINADINFINSTNFNTIIGIGGSNSSFINSSYSNNFFIHATCNIVLNANNNTSSSIPHLFISTTGNIGIGTSTNLTSNLNIASGLNVLGTSTFNSNIVCRNNLGNIPSIGINGSTGDRIIIQQANTTTTYPYSIGYNTNTLWFSGPVNTQYIWYSNATSNMILDSSGNLTVWNDITGFNSASDIKLKENIKSLNVDCLNLINKIEPVEFIWKDIELVPSNKRNKKDYGFIAQDIEKIIPNIVYDNPSYKTIKYEKLTTYLVKAIQELNNKFDNLSNMIYNK